MLDVDSFQFRFISAAPARLAVYQVNIKLSLQLFKTKTKTQKNIALFSNGIIFDCSWKFVQTIQLSQTHQSSHIKMYNKQLVTSHQYIVVKGWKLYIFVRFFHKQTTSTITVYDYVWSSCISCEFLLFFLSLWFFYFIF